MPDLIGITIRVPMLLARFFGALRPCLVILLVRALVLLVPLLVFLLSLAGLWHVTLPWDAGRKYGGGKHRMNRAAGNLFH